MVQENIHSRVQVALEVQVDWVVETGLSEDVIGRTWFERIHTCPLGGRTDPPENNKNRSNELVRFIEIKVKIIKFCLV